MNYIINEALRSLETAHNVRIIYACESGSRAWGFASKNSDYDVRFVYARPTVKYLQIYDERDVIEFMDGDLDISGWDIKKALYLARKGNPPLYEWMTSPIVYHETKSAEILEDAVRLYQSSKEMAYHYFHMARGNYKSYLTSYHVLAKKYLYVIRPLLCVKWVMSFNEPPPVLFDSLLTKDLMPKHVKREVMSLLEEKRNGEELGWRLPSTVMNSWIESELDYWWDNGNQGRLQRMESHRFSAVPLDKAFRDILTTEYGNRI